jgi:hypothetical protein
VLFFFFFFGGGGGGEGGGNKNLYYQLCKLISTKILKIILNDLTENIVYNYGPMHWA